MYNEYFFVLDALRADHLKYMPWLNSKINHGVYSENYTISEGFCERMEIFTSQKPLDFGFFTAFTLKFSEEVLGASTKAIICVFSILLHLLNDSRVL